MSDSSDIEMQSPLPKETTKKPPKSKTTEILKKHDSKKITTKEMIHQALVDLKSRKGTSMYAIKKYIEEYYEVDVEKINYLINKHIKASVESGTIVQTKGKGASGSFKMATGTDKLGNKKNKPKKETKVTDKTEKSKEKPAAKAKPAKKETEKKVEKRPKKVEIAKSAENKDKKDKSAPSDANKKKGKEKSVKLMKTPSKKRAAMMKRKSIGSIIKPPKMKPTAEV